MNINDWLRVTGLGQYEAIFRDNAIDADILPDLTENDLEKLGIPLGHRKRLLKAIAGLTEATVARSAVPPNSEAGAERRQITVMFCDLVGSTALSTRLDPEDMRTIIGTYHRCCVALIESRGGFVARYFGDGVLAYFGYPHAHEHDAERAVQAGLAIVAAVPKLTTPIASPLAVRVGIATGLVVVGDLLRAGDAPERSVVGETPNLAARLQAAAQPNMVVIAESTRSLVGNLFELRDLEASEFKGIVGPVRSWAVLRASTVDSRFDALHTSGLTALVGREEELELLLRRWSRSKAAQGQAVLLSGEAGIGKSRLTVTLMDAIGAEPHTRLRYFCSPQHTDSALHPIIVQMERAAGLAHDDAPRSKLDKLDSLLALTATSPRDAALLAEMLSLPNDGRYPALPLDLPQRRQLTLEALVTQLEALSRSGSVLIIFEDVHWIDPTSLEALSQILERVRGLRVLLIVTYRPEFAAPWIGQPHVTTLTINRLAECEVSTIAHRVAGDKALSQNVLRDILERSDGIPLFVEEITKAALEADIGPVAVAASIPSPVPPVPASLHASLMARLDRLGEAKEIAQIGAAIGREFSHTLVAAIARKSEDEIDQELSRLVSAGLLFRQGMAPHVRYLFKHALVQDAAYGTLLRAPRRQLHADIATAIRSCFPEIARDQPELVAMHFINAESYKEALPYILAAARNFTRRYSYVEALRWFERGAQILRDLPAEQENERFELDLTVDWTPVLMTVNGFLDHQTSSVARRAETLCRQFGEMDRLLPVLFAQVSFYGAGGSLAQGLEFVPRILQIGEQTGDPIALMIAHRFAGFCYLWLARFEESAAELLQALACSNRFVATGLAERFGHDPETTSIVLLGSVKQCIGQIEAGEALMRTALAKARQLAHPLTLGYVLRHYAIFATLQKNYSAVFELSEELTRVTLKYRLRHYFELGPLMTEWSRVRMGEKKNSVAVVLERLARLRETGFRRNMPFYMMLVADVLFELGETDQARELCDEALSTMQQMNEAWLAPYLRELLERVKKSDTR